MPGKYGKYTEEQWRKNLVKLESIFGQKELARRLGVTTATIRNWKYGRSSPSKAKAKKANYIYGQNKRKLDFGQLRKTVKRSKVRKKAREKQKRRQPHLISTSDFIDRYLEDYSKEIKEQLRAKVPPFVAVSDGRGQFVDVPEIDAERYGKPKGTMTVEIIGIYTSEYVKESETVDGVRVVIDGYVEDELHVSPMPILTDVHREWSLEQTLDYLEKQFYGTGYQQGRRRLNPERFVGYRLRRV